MTIHAPRPVRPHRQPLGLAATRTVAFKLRLRHHARNDQAFVIQNLIPQWQELRDRGAVRIQRPLVTGPVVPACPLPPPKSPSQRAILK